MWLEIVNSKKKTRIKTGTAGMVFYIPRSASGVILQWFFEYLLVSRLVFCVAVEYLYLE